MITFDEIIEHVLEKEGGYVNDPTDLGGETKFLFYFHHTSNALLNHPNQNLSCSGFLTTKLA